MHETPQGFFHLDQPAPEATLPAGPVKLAGWTAGTHGRHFVDLRIRWGETIAPAVYGFPRADLAAFFKIAAPFLPGGFEAFINLPIGTTELVFEVLDIAGQWHVMHRQAITCSAAAEAQPATAKAAPVIQPHEFARALLSVLRDSAGQSPESTAQQQATTLPNPAVLRFPHLPFHGHLHQPTLIERVLFGRLRIEGWLFHETQRIRRVSASVDLQTWQDLELGGRKSYVEELYPQFPNAIGCRIDGLIDIPAQIPAPICVRLYAELEDGSWHLCHAQRVATWEQEIEKRPLAPYSLGTFARVAMALNRACRDRGFAIIHNRDFWRGLRQARREYRLRARPSVCPALSASSDGDFSLPHAGTAPTPRRITFFTHNLAHEGAPLFLLELAREYRTAGAQLHVVSAVDGPLAAAYHQLGATVQIIDDASLRTATNRTALREALATLGYGINLSETDLVVVNTLSLWWAVHLAHRSRRPSLFYLHESSTPATFYLGHMMQDALPLIQESFRLATCASFLTETTRAYYRPWLGRANHGINPGWIDVAAIDRELAGQSRADVRRQFDVRENERLIVNVGSVCDRKGQHIFTRGVDLFWRQHPELAATCRFLMVGGRDTLFDRDLRALLQQLGHYNLAIIPTTASPLGYYQAADLFVCSSYEESLPRVIMEAMAARLPILSTAVHGINDLLPALDYGTLIPPGNSQAICDGLHLMLTKPEDTARQATRARERVVTHFNSATLLPRHIALAARVASVRL